MFLVLWIAQFILGKEDKTPILSKLCEFVEFIQRGELIKELK